MWPRVPKELGIFLASFAAFGVGFALEVTFNVALGEYYFLGGIPTPFEAPLIVYVINLGLTGAYAALAYAIVMKLWFGKVSLARVALLWAFGLVFIAGLGRTAAISVSLTANVALYVGFAAYFVLSMLVARDWVSR